MYKKESIMDKMYIIANWKQYLSYQRGVAWLTHNSAEFTRISAHTRLILCPPYELLSRAHDILQKTGVYLGAQACSPFDQGAHTGYVGAQSLKDLGVTYCLIGHSERRTQAHETDEQLKAQIGQLAQHAITPIICIGEDAQRRAQGRTLKHLEAQLTPLLEYTAMICKPDTRVIVAYEPVYAIGTGSIPSKEDLADVFDWLRRSTREYGNLTIDCIYGGSVTQATIQALTDAAHMQGFLVGKASTDFQELKNIVSWIEDHS